MAKLTTIIPLYNGEKYISRCLESVTNQGLDISEHEILIVNDGSKDNGPLIVKDYQKTHSNIVLVNKENGGVSSARNLGISMATGEYIHFMDVDDELVVDSYKYLLDEKTGYDIIKFSSVTVDNRIDVDAIIKKSAENSVWECFNNTNDYVKVHGFMIFVWGCLYRRTLLNEVLFKPYKISEDVLFNIELMCSNSKISIVATNKVLYKYYVSIDSATTLASKNHVKTYVQNMMGISMEVDNVYHVHPEYSTCFADIKKNLQRQAVTRLLSGAFAYKELCGLVDSCNENRLFPICAQSKSEKIMSLLISHPCLMWLVSPLYRNIFLKFVKPYIKRN